MYNFFLGQSLVTIFNKSNYRNLCSWLLLDAHAVEIHVDAVSAVGKISGSHQKVLRFNPWPGHGLNFGEPSFATLSMDIQAC